MSTSSSALRSLSQDALASDAQRARHQRILDETVALASQGGFDAVQMRAVAEHADVALGTLYRYFPSKIHLLVSALARELAQANAAWERQPVTEDDPADRVCAVLARATASMQQDPHLTEALTRAFTFADATVAEESHAVAREVSRLLNGAMVEPGGAEHLPTDEHRAITRVISDVWFAGLVQWVTGRATADEVTDSLHVAVRLLLR